MKRAAREFLVIFVVVAVAVSLTGNGLDGGTDWWYAALGGMWFALWIAPVIWASYRFVRFALTR